jgi:hypothetical protein
MSDFNSGAYDRYKGMPRSGGGGNSIDTSTLSDKNNQVLQIQEANKTNAVLGERADLVATTDTGTFSLIALFKRLLERITGIVNNQTNGSQVVQVTGISTAQKQNDILTRLAAIETAVSSPQQSAPVTDVSLGTVNVSSLGTQGLAITDRQGISNRSFPTLYFKITGTFVASFIVEGSDDIGFSTINTFPIAAYNETSRTAMSATLTTSGSYSIDATPYRYIRIRTSAYTSGSAVISSYGRFYDMKPIIANLITRNVAITGTPNVSISNTPTVVTTSASTGIGRLGNIITSGAVTTLKASAGVLTGFSAYNNTATIQYVHLYNNGQSAANNYGIYPVPPNSGTYIPFPTSGLRFPNSITVQFSVSPLPVGGGTAIVADGCTGIFYGV